MTIRIILSSYGSNVGPYFRLIALPSNSVISLFELPWIGMKDFTAPAGTTHVKIEHVTATGAPGLCESTVLLITLLNATTTTTTTSGTSSTTTTTEEPSTTTTTTTGGIIPPTSTTTTSSSSTTTTSSSTTSTTTTTVESCGIIGNMIVL